MISTKLEKNILFGTLCLLTLLSQQKNANAILFYTVQADVLARASTVVNQDSVMEVCTSITDLTNPCSVETLVTATGGGSFAFAFGKAELSADLRLDFNDVVAEGSGSGNSYSYFAQAFTTINGNVLDFDTTLNWGGIVQVAPVALKLNGNTNDFSSFSLTLLNEDTGTEIAQGEAIFDGLGFTTSGNLWNDGDWSFQNGTFVLNKTQYTGLLNLPGTTNISVNNVWTVQGENIGSQQESSASASSQAVPEHSSNSALLALGTFGVASILKRKLKQAKSTEKDTTKVG